ncbi:hypothetical protein CEXT_232001 [Caerostris extrusa]|uniref:Uncharacterized protein n=1 Tax=Caerostris extrusa TaxID=172846 RepID=A0AAV4Y6W4_CAEEX|nr:hypothetical protein CEXT_232001 [Caerostris extrusa]
MFHCRIEGGRLTVERKKDNSSPDGKVHYTKMESCVWSEPLAGKNLMFHCRLEGGRWLLKKKVDLLPKWMEIGDGTS